MSVLSEALLSFVRSDLMSFSFLSARHSLEVYVLTNFFNTI